MSGVDSVSRSRESSNFSPESPKSLSSGFSDAGDVSYHQLTDASFSVVAHVDFSTGLVRQWMSYDAFGVMKVLRPGDFDASGVVNVNDWDEFNDDFVDPALLRQ